MNFQYKAFVGKIVMNYLISHCYYYSSNIDHYSCSFCHRCMLDYLPIYLGNDSNLQLSRTYYCSHYSCLSFNNSTPIMERAKNFHLKNYQKFFLFDNFSYSINFSCST